MKIFLLIIIFCCSVISCRIGENLVVSQEKQKVVLPKVFEKDGVKFSYPGDWKIRHDEVISDLGRVVAVEDSKDSIFMISLFSLEVPLTLEEYAEDVKKEWRARVKKGKDFEIKTSEVTRNILYKPTKGLRLKFLFENVPHTQDIFLIKGREKNVTFFVQTIDSNLQNADKDFQIIFDSIKFE